MQNISLDVNQTGSSNLIFRHAPGTKAKMECVYNRRVNVSDSGWAVNVDGQTDMITTDIEQASVSPASDIFDLGLSDGSDNEGTGLNIGEEVAFRTGLETGKHISKANFKKNLKKLEKSFWTKNIKNLLKKI